MAMNSATLTAAIVARFKGLWRSEAPSGDEQNEDYFLTQLARIISEEVVDHITNNAKCSGNDSGGDSHANVGIV